MKINFFVAVALSLSVAFTACDDTTDTIGNSLTDTSDLLDVATATFDVSSSSFTVDSVLSRNTTGYLGKIRDPESGNYITGDFMAQFGTQSI